MHRLLSSRVEQAIVASVKLARSRILELCERFGVDTYLGALDLMLDRNKRAMSELIRTSVPNEELYFEDYVCDDSLGHGPYKYVRLWVVCVAGV